MKTRYLIYVLIVILTACGTQPPDIDPERFTTCYTFDFLSETYDLTIVSGTQTSNGLESVNGVLGATYNHIMILEPQYIRAEIEVIIPDSNSRRVQGTFNVFGVESSLQTDVPATTINTISGVPSDSATYASIASISLATSADTIVRVRKLTVYLPATNNINTYGFDRNDCGDTQPPTPSPTYQILPSVTPTATITATPTLTPSPTATNTVEPTATPNPNWCYTLLNGDSRLLSAYDGRPFSLSSSSINHNGAAGDVKRSGVGGFSLVFPQPTKVTSISFDVTYDLSRNHFPQGISSANAWYYTNGSSSPARASLSLSRPFEGDRLVGSASLGRTFSSETAQYYDKIGLTVDSYWFDPGSSWTLSTNEIRLRGIGYNPFGYSNCGDNAITPTPSPTINPTLVTYTPTFTPSPTVTATYRATREPAPLPTLAPTATPDPTVDNNSYTPNGTCSSTGSEPGSSSDGGWFEWLFSGVRNLVVCTVIPQFQFLGSLLNQSLAFIGSIYDVVVGLASDVAGRIAGAMSAIAYRFQLLISGFFNTILSWFFWMFFKFLPWLIANIANFFAMALFSVNMLMRGIWGLFFDLLSFMMSFTFKLLTISRNILNFALNGVSLSQRVYLLWINTPAVTPPGLPDCINAPLQSDICAVHYVLEYTMFAGIGAFIIPALTVYLLLLIAFFFLETVVERIQKIWEVLRA